MDPHHIEYAKSVQHGSPSKCKRPLQGFLAGVRDPVFQQRTVLRDRLLPRPAPLNRVNNRSIAAYADRVFVNQSFDARVSETGVSGAAFTAAGVSRTAL